jgi:hypothetical protein
MNVGTDVWSDTSSVTGCRGKSYRGGVSNRTSVTVSVSSGHFVSALATSVTRSLVVDSKPT